MISVLASDCCFSELDKNPTQRVGLEQSGSHLHLIENELVLAMIQMKNILNYFKGSSSHNN